MSELKETNNEDTCCNSIAALVLKNFWVVYPILGICFLQVLWIMNTRIDAVAANTQEYVAPAKKFKDIIEPKGSFTLESGLTPELIIEPDAVLLSEGHSIFGAQCAACHGQDGKGSIPNARDFTSNANWKNGFNFLGMFKTVTDGTDAGMPAFPNMSPKDKVSVISYIRTLSDHYGKVSDKDVKDFGDLGYFSQKIPNRIPLKMASKLLALEYKAEYSKIQNIIDEIKKDKSNTSILIKSNTDDLEKTVVSLVNRGVWKRDVEALINFLRSNIQSNGISVKLLASNKEDLGAIHSYLKSVIK